MKVLSINTYGGSLLLASKMARMKVVASLEDCGFGSDLQALNFPNIPLCRTTPWPTSFAGNSWDNLCVIAHPPCAAFSMQNRNATKRGIETDAFKCHRNVMDYALSHGCAALAIESVVGALAAARPVYDEYATKYGYYPYYILQNACSFGVPQWRPRFWVWFLKQDSLTIEFQHKFRCLSDTITLEGDEVRGEESIMRRAEKFIYNCSDDWRGNIIEVLRKQRPDLEDGTPNQTKLREHLNLVGFFKTSLPYYLEPYSFAKTVVKESFWFMHGKPLTRQDYCRIMGFPPNYKWGKDSKKFRTFLSKGICPPVGKWVLEQIVANNRWPKLKGHAPGSVIDLQPKRKEAEQIIRQRLLI